jgi:hypothetical protein
MENVMSKHHYILAASLALRCCWFQGKKESKYTVSSEQVLGSPDCALLFEKANNGNCLPICFYI